MKIPGEAESMASYNALQSYVRHRASGADTSRFANDLPSASSLVGPFDFQQVASAFPFPLQKGTSFRRLAGPKSS